jgi:hypothetical protein
MNAVQMALDNNSHMTIQEAIDHVDILVKRSIKDWLLSQVEVPSWGEVVDKDVQKYLTAVLDQARGNLGWS